jgi:predicted amidohydrolase
MNAPPSSRRVATVQFQSVPDDIPANLAIVDAFTEEATTAGAVLVAFPEMCLLGYWHLRNHDEATLHGLAQPAGQLPLCRGCADAVGDRCPGR